MMIFEPIRYSRTFFIPRGPKFRENSSRCVDMAHVTWGRMLQQRKLSILRIQTGR